MEWTPEAIERVRHLASTGLSAAQVALQIGGVTRNMVVGIAHRQKFHFISSVRSPRKKSETNGDRPKGRSDRKPKQEVEIAAEPPRTGMLTLMELDLDSCRYIFGDIVEFDNTRVPLG